MTGTTESRDVVTVDTLSYHADRWLASVERLRYEAQVIFANSDLFNQTCASRIEKACDDMAALVLASE